MSPEAKRLLWTCVPLCGTQESEDAMTALDAYITSLEANDRRYVKLRAVVAEAQGQNFDYLDKMLDDALNDPESISVAVDVAHAATALTAIDAAMQPEGGKTT